MRYRGVPADGLRLIDNMHGERTFFSENWPDKARQWLPMIDHPYDKATDEFIITAPAKYQVVANGLLQEEIDSWATAARTHWKQSVPIASWLDAIGVAQFATQHFGVVRGVPHAGTGCTRRIARTASRLRDAGAARDRVLQRTRSARTRTRSSRTSQAAGIGGGTGTRQAIFYGETSVTPRRRRDLVAHEIAHQWFGNAVTERDWDDVWLSEGFATYFTRSVTEHFSGRDAFVAGPEGQQSRCSRRAGRTARHGDRPRQPRRHAPGAEPA